MTHVVWHSLPENIVNGHLNSIILQLKDKRDVTSSTNAYILAAAYDHLDIVKWLSKHRPEVKKALHMGLYSITNIRCRKC